MYDLKSGDIIKIRNTSGLLNVTLDKKLNMRNITLGLHQELPEFKNLRIEFHEKEYSEKIISLYNHFENCCDIYLIFNIDSLEDIEIWKGTFEDSEEEENIFVTHKYD